MSVGRKRVSFEIICISHFSDLTKACEIRIKVQHSYRLKLREKEGDGTVRVHVDYPLTRLQGGVPTRSGLYQ